MDWYISQISGERLQEHWSSGSFLLQNVLIDSSRFISHNPNGRGPLMVVVVAGLECGRLRINVCKCNLRACKNE